MTVEERADPKGGPFCNMGQACFSGLDAVARSYEPALKGAARWNLEVLGLMTRRAEAWLSIPGRVGRCRTPQDLAREQLQFWQVAAHDYADGARRLAAAAGAWTLQGLSGARDTAAEGPARDYMTFAQPRVPEFRESERDRRAA